MQGQKNFLYRCKILIRRNGQMKRKISRFLSGMISAALIISSGNHAVFAREYDSGIRWSAVEADLPEDQENENPETEENSGTVLPTKPSSDQPAPKDTAPPTDLPEEDPSANQPKEGDPSADQPEGTDPSVDQPKEADPLSDPPANQPKETERTGGQDEMKGAVEVLITAGIKIEKAQEFQVELKGAASAAQKAVLAPVAEDALDAPQVSVRFPDLEAGTYELRVSGVGYVTYVQTLQVDGLAYRVQLYTGETAVGTDKAHPGVLAKGDLNGDGKLDSKDTELLINAIDAGNYQSEYDLYGDGKVDLLDLNYLSKIMGKSMAATPEKLIPLEAAVLTVPEGSVVSGDMASFQKGDNGLTLSLAQGAAELEFDFSRYQNMPVMEEILIGAPLKEENGIASGIIVIETEDGGTVAAAIKGRTGMEMVASRTEEFDITPNPDGSIRIDLKKQIAVKKVTIRITKTMNSNNLAEITSVEFVNDMASRIPEPEMNVPKNLSVQHGNKSFTAKWDAQNNVTAYEVRIVSEGQTDYRRTATNSISVQQFLGDKMENGTPYEISVQSLNGEWKSGYSASVTVIPKADAKPLAPDYVKVTGGYQNIEVRWKNMKDTDSYNLYYKEDGSESYEKITGITGTYHQVTGLKDNTKYLVYLTGTNELGEGPASLIASDKTISGLIPAKLPTYKLINTSNGEGKLSNHIVSAVIGGGAVSMVDSPLDKEAGSALGAFDNSYTSYIDRQDWDYGGAYPGSGKGVTVELDAVYEIGMITLAQPMDVGEFAYANIQYQDENGKMLTAKDVTISQRRSGDRKYYLIKVKEPIRTSRLQIGIGHRYGYYKVAISEIRLHEYDSLEKDILALYADDLYITLKDGVNEAAIRELQTRLDTPDPVSGEYHPERDALQKELDAAKALLATEGLGKVIQVNPDITSQKDNGIALGGLMSRQPLGVTAAAEEQIVVYVGNPGMKSGVNTNLKLVFTQQHAEANGLSQEVALKTGRNEIQVPKFSSTEAERGGPLYVRYTGNNPEDQYAVRVSGGTVFPILNVYRVSDEERSRKIEEYVKELKEYVNRLEATHNSDHASSQNEQVNAYEYKAATCILNTTDIVSDYMMLSVPASQVLAGLGSEATGSLESTLQAMDQMLILFYQHKGLTDSFAEGTPDAVVQKNHLPYQCLNIRYMKMFGEAFMYASGDHVGIEWGSVPGLMGGTPVQADASGKYQSGRYFGWGIAHEIGHQINQSAYAHAEVTNNYFSVLAQAKDENSTVRFDYSKVFEKVTSGATGYSNNVFTQLGMYWQLHLAYDRDYNYKTYGTWQEIQDHLFFARVDRYARDTASAPSPGGVKLSLSGDRDQKLMRLASAAAEHNLTEFFNRWGMVPDETTRSYMRQFPEEKRAIYYVDDNARVYEMTHSTGVKTAVTSVQAKGNPEGSVSLTIASSGDSEAIQGYEITRVFTEWGKVRREIAGFTRDLTFKDQAAFAAGHVVAYEVRAVDKWMNYSEACVSAPVKVQGSGILDKTSWLVSTNMVSDEDKVPDGTEELPCEPTMESAITKVIDGDDSHTYTGKSLEEEPYIILQMNRREEVSALNYTCKGGSGTAISDYLIEVSTDGEHYEKVAEGKFTLGESGARVYFTDDSQRIHICDAAYVKLTAVGQTGKNLSVTELELYGPSGDNVEISAGEIGILSEDYYYDSANKKNKIPGGSVIFTGTYKGNPAYNVVVLYDADGNIVGGTDDEGTLTAHQIILAPPLADDDALLGNVSEGRWIYWLEPADGVDVSSLPEEVRAELYRVDDALTNEGQRLVSDSMLVKLPEKLPSVTLE